MEARDSVPSVRRPRPALFRVAARDPRGVREDVDSAASTDGAGWDRPALRSSPGAAQGRVQPHGLGAGAVSRFGCAVEMGRSQRAAHRTRRVTWSTLNLTMTQEAWSKSWGPGGKCSAVGGPGKA